MINDGYQGFLLPEDGDDVLRFWKHYLEDRGQHHPMAAMPEERLKRTIPIVLYGDEGSSKTGANGFMLGTWFLGEIKHSCPYSKYSVTLCLANDVCFFCLQDTPQLKDGRSLAY